MPLSRKTITFFLVYCKRSLIQKALTDVQSYFSREKYGAPTFQLAECGALKKPIDALFYFRSLPPPSPSVRPTGGSRLHPPPQEGREPLLIMRREKRRAKKKLQSKTAEGRMRKLFPIGRRKCGGFFPGLRRLCERLSLQKEREGSILLVFIAVELFSQLMSVMFFISRKHSPSKLDVTATFVACNIERPERLTAHRNTTSILWHKVFHAIVELLIHL